MTTNTQEPTCYTIADARRRTKNFQFLLGLIGVLIFTPFLGLDIYLFTESSPIIMMHLVVFIVLSLLTIIHARLTSDRAFVLMLESSEGKKLLDKGGALTLMHDVLESISKNFEQVLDNLHNLPNKARKEGEVQYSDWEDKMEDSTEFWIAGMRVRIDHAMIECGQEQREFLAKIRRDHNLPSSKQKEAAVNATA